MCPHDECITPVIGVLKSDAEYSDQETGARSHDAGQQRQEQQTAARLLLVLHSYLCMVILRRPFETRSMTPTFPASGFFKTVAVDGYAVESLAGLSWKRFSVAGSFLQVSCSASCARERVRNS